MRSGTKNDSFLVEIPWLICMVQKLMCIITIMMHIFRDSLSVHLNGFHCKILAYGNCAKTVNSIERKAAVLSTSHPLTFLLIHFPM